MHAPAAIVGQVLLWTGFIAAALAAVWRLDPVDGWTVPWLQYGIAMAVGCAGIVLIRVSKAARALADEHGEARFSTLTRSLEALISGVGELRGICASESPKLVVQYIDEQLAESFADFADARYALVDRFGMDGFADVMTQFASGERFVNRAWSASADGYRHEAQACLERAEGHLRRAEALMAEHARLSDG